MKTHSMSPSVLAAMVLVLLTVMAPFLPGGW